MAGFSSFVRLNHIHCCNQIVINMAFGEKAEICAAIMSPRAAREKVSYRHQDQNVLSGRHGGFSASALPFHFIPRLPLFSLSITS